ncbi:hypothetical protein E4Z66_02345 [Aliishimia ponticola]|uniref:Sulfotransferase family protein n=1 Tax=Aliishimia ponticola TaxID=2499833 RepID=A0A4S4NJK0_9RHOB|nr:hypothetical protein [Aliishimia ponticola]THH38431.1 hypothetical protein E4Z66_02345 [Aliishimia ponticola]
MARDIYLHAGAHRTGTSSFQMALHVNRAVLKDAGYALAYPGRDGIPSGRLSLKLPAPRHGPKQAERFANRLAEQFANSDKPLIMSEENIPGRMFHFYAGRFYPAAEARLQTLRAGFANATFKRVVYVIRPYDALYVSAFRKRAEDNPVRPFSEIRPKLLEMDRGWPEIAALMRDILQPEELVILSYARRGSSRDLLSRLLPETFLTLDEPEQIKNLSATDRALEAVQARYAAGEALTRAQWKAIIAEYAEETEPRGFATFEPKQRAQLQARYADDLTRIGDMPGVTLIS